MTTARRSVRTLLFLGAVVAALAGAACDKGNKGGGGGGGNGKGMAGASAIAPQGGLSRALSLLPGNSEFVAAVDFAQVRKSALWKKYEPMVLERGGKELGEFKALCGFDPIEKASGLVMGGRGKELGEATILVRGFDKASVTTCVQKAVEKSKAEGKNATATIDGNYFELTGDGEPMRFVFVDDTTVMIKKSGDAAASKDELMAALAAKPTDGLMASAAFSSLVDATDTGAAIWFVVNGKAAFIPGDGMIKFDAAFGSVRVASGIDAGITLRMKDSKDAKEFVGMAKPQLDQGKSFMPALKGVSISQADKDVKIGVKLDQAALEEMQGMMGMMGGGR